MQGVIDGELETAALALWPGTSARCEFRPLLAGTADFSTEFCIRLSAELNISPSIVAEKVLSRMRPVPGAQLEARHDLLYLSIADEQLIEIERLVGHGDMRDSIIALPDYRPGSSTLAYARTASLAWEQFLVSSASGMRCELLVGENQFKDPGSLEGYRRLLLEAREDSRTAGGVRPLYEVAQQSKTEQVFFWLANDSLPKQEFQDFYHSCVHKRPLRCLRCPDPNWLKASYEFSPPPFVCNADPHMLFSLMMYLASPVGSEDLDLNVPMFEEKSNVLWYLSSLRDRVGRIEAVRQEWSVGEKGVCSMCSPSSMPLLSRARCIFPYFLRRACVHAEVRELNDALRQLASFLSVTLNEPSVRRSLQEGDAYPQSQIVYSVLREFSAIMTWV